MKVSILVANYNYEVYLPQAIDSLLNQEHQDIEIVIVDDESVDRSREIIQQLHAQYPEKIKYVFQKNTGHGGALSSGFEVCTGEIIAFLDSDDLWNSDKLSRILPIFQADPEVMGVIHPLQIIDRNGEKGAALEAVPEIPNGNIEKLFLDTGAAWYYPPTSAITLRRKVMETLLPTDAHQWRKYPDGCLLYSAGFLGKVIPVPVILGSYRLHGGNTYAHDARYAPDPSMQREMLSGVEQSIHWINSFLMKINNPCRVDLSNNLNYLRAIYYLRSSFNWPDSKKISYKILTWPFYSWQQRALFFVRFWGKNLKIILNMNSTLVTDK